MLNKIIKNEEILISLIGLIGFFLIITALAIAHLTDWYFVAGMIVFAIALLGIGSFLQSKGKHSIDKRYDERKANCVHLAARNGYVFALLAIGAMALISSMGYNPLGLLRSFVLAYILIMIVQVLSYLHYLGRGLA